MTKPTLSMLALAGTLLACAPSEPAGDAAPTTAEPVFEFELVAEGVYQARGTGSLTVGSNAGIVINEDDVLLVDSHVSPAAASALLDELRAITDKPVRYVVDTHFHFDHAHGNQVYPPDVEVIGHEFTREMLASGESLGRTYQRFTESWADRPGFTQSQEGLVPTPPNTTLSERMTLFRGGREIRLLFFGRGHTGGDVVVHLPAERILMTGDLLLPFLPYMGDGFPVEWVRTLEELKALDFGTVVPGHGPPFTDRAMIDHLQAYLEDLWAEASAARAAGLSVEEAAASIDLTAHADHFAQLSEVGAPLPAVERIYDLLDGADGSDR